MTPTRALTRTLFLAAVMFVTVAQGFAAPSAGSQPREVIALAKQIAALSDTIRPEEARQAAACAVETSVDLARTYQVAGPPQVHNFLVNIGVKKRGLCHHWARDLIQRLRALKLRSFDLHWGAARAGTLREHNAVILTAKRQPFVSGIVLDPWRHSGRLFSGPVATDRYPWKEDLTDCFCSRTRGVATRHALRRR